MEQPEHLIFVCQNLRGDQDPRGSCMTRGGAEIFAHLKQRRAEHGLKRRLRVMGASCLGACAAGITALHVDRGGATFYGRLDLECADALIDELVRGSAAGPRLHRHRLPPEDLEDLSALAGGVEAESIGRHRDGQGEAT